MFSVYSPARPVWAALSFAIAFGSTAAVARSQSCETENHNAQSLLAAQRNAEAETLLSHVITRADASPLCKGSAWVYLGFAQYRLGKMDEAQRSGSESLRQLESAFGQNSPYLREPLLLLAQVAYIKTNIRRAAVLLDRADAIPDPAHSYLAASHGLKGSFFLAESQYEQAETEFLAALAERANAGQGQAEISIPELLHLALVYLKLDSPEKSLPRLQAALSISQHSPPNAELEINTQLLLAMAQARLHRTNEAEEAFALAQGKLPDLPPSLREPVGRNVYERYAAFLKQTGRKARAKQLAREELSMFGPERPPLTVSADSLLQSNSAR